MFIIKHGRGKMPLRHYQTICDVSTYVRDDV